MLLFFFGLFPLFIGLKKVSTSWFFSFKLSPTVKYSSNAYFWIPLISTKSYFSLFSVKNGFKKYWYVMELLIYIKYIKKLILKNTVNTVSYSFVNSSFWKFSKYFLRLVFNKAIVIGIFKFFFFLQKSFFYPFKINLTLNEKNLTCSIKNYMIGLKTTSKVLQKEIFPLTQDSKNFLKLRFNTLSYSFKFFFLYLTKYNLLKQKMVFLYFLVNFKQSSLYLESLVGSFKRPSSLTSPAKNKISSSKNFLLNSFKQLRSRKHWSMLFLKKNKFFKIFLSKKYLKVGRKRRFFFKKFFFHKKKKNLFKAPSIFFNKSKSKKLNSNLTSVSKIKKNKVSLKSVFFQNLLNGFFFNQFFFFHTPSILKKSSSFFKQPKKSSLTSLKKNFFFLLVNFFKSFLFKNLSFFVNRDIFLKKFLKTCFLCYKQFVKKYWRFLKIPKLLKKVFFALIFFFIYKNVVFLKKTLKSLVTTLNFKKQKKLFYFFRYLVGTFLKVFYKSFCVEGFMVMFKGKFSTLVGGRKKIFKCFFSKISSTKYLCYFKWVNIKTTTKLGVTNIKILCTFL